MSSFRITTPHAAVLIWNYDDRIGVPEGDYKATGVNAKQKNQTEKDKLPVIISTLSCVSIATSKSKSQPEGSFNIVLAPFKNWTSTLTPGSWCAILMSNEPITEDDLKHASAKKVKMFGRIESVRCETKMTSDGARETLYYVSGVDWGSIFNSMLYVDNLIASLNDPQSQGNVIAVALRKALFGDRGSPTSFVVKDNLASILNLMGQNLAGITEAANTIQRLGSTIYEYTLPDPVAKYFKFVDAQGNPVTPRSVNKAVTLKTGSLIGKDKYKDFEEAVGFIDPFSIQGTHTLWQILLENSNPSLNEMFTDMNWNEKDDTVQLAIYNRIRPFSYKNFTPQAGSSTNLRSYFQFVREHRLEDEEVISVNAGTNWRDKFNFVEIKPSFQEFTVVANWYKQKSQVFDAQSFEREGFRPLIFDTKQFPSGGAKGGLPTDVNIKWDQLEVWAKLLREWYFGTHRLLNGTITLVGTTEYIGVGNNIKFDAGLINPTANINSATKQKGKNQFILAHVESVSHQFTVDKEGAREYMTTIQFVRGIVVDRNNINVGEGMLDQDATLLTQADDRNTKNVVSYSDKADPDPQKVRGT